MSEYVTIEDVDAAYRDCRRHKGSTYGCIDYQMDYLQNNLQLYRELNSMTYEVGKSKAFCVTRPKLREVFCAQFRDRIIHHLLALKFSDMLEEDMIPDAYACRKGKGVEYGVNRTKEQTERVSEGYTKEAWVLKCDLQGFFMSIDRKLIYRMLEDVVRKKYHGDDIEWWLWLWRKVVLNDPAKNCVRVGDLTLWDKLPRNKSLFTSEGKGLPIGNLPSQLLANLLLTPFDKWVLSRIGEGGGYGRYVDDFIVISRDKRLLLGVLHDAREYLKVNLGLTLHPRKVSLQKADKGVRFIGATIRPHRVYANPRTVQALLGVIGEWNATENPTDEETLKYVMRCNSYLGYLVHRNSRRVREQAWRSIRHKEKVYCLNMRCLKIKNEFKIR